MTLADDLSSHLGDWVMCKWLWEQLQCCPSRLGLWTVWAVWMYLSELRLLVCPFDLPSHANTHKVCWHRHACVSALVDGGAWGLCHTFAAKALTWPLQSTDLSWPTGVKQAHTHIDCASDHLFLYSLFIFLVKGVKERKGTEANQSADVATSYFSSHRKKIKKVIFDSGAFCLLLILFTKLTFSTVAVCVCSRSTYR